LVASPTVSSNVGFNITKTVTLTVNYDNYFLYEQYFLKSSFTFQPPLQGTGENYRVEMVINEVIGSITTTPEFYKTDGLITYIAVSANYNKEITINTPISSYNIKSDNYYNGHTDFDVIVGDNIVATDSILIITCDIYNSSNQLVASPIVYSSDYSNATFFDISKTVSMKIYEEFYYQYEQYFTNVTFKFRPTFKNSSDTYRIEMLINKKPTGNKINTPVFTKSNLLVTSIGVEPYYRKKITIQTPISSYNYGSNAYNTLNFTHTITSIACNVYDDYDNLIATPTVNSSNGLNITKTVTVYGDAQEPTYYYEQYFTNVTFSFTPTYQTGGAVYRIELVVTGTGQWRFNTDISTRVRNNVYSIQFNTGDSSGYLPVSYYETVYNGSEYWQVNTDVSTRVKNVSTNDIIFNTDDGEGYTSANYTEFGFGSGQWSVNTNINTNYRNGTNITFNNANGTQYATANYTQTLIPIGTGTYSNRIFYCNTTAIGSGTEQGLIPPYTYISPLNRFIAFSGYGNQIDYNSLSIEFINLTEGNYILDVWMAKRLSGNDYIEIISTYIINGITTNTSITIPLIDTINEWNKYSYEFSSLSINNSFKFKINVYGYQTNQIIGIGSVKIFKNDLFFIPNEIQSYFIQNEKFELNVLPPNTTNVLLEGSGQINTFSITGWYIRSFNNSGSNNKVYFTNQTIFDYGDGLVTPPIDICETRQFLAFYGTGNMSGGNYLDYYSIQLLNSVYIPIGTYTFEIWMSKRIIGLDFIIVVLLGKEYRIDLFNIANVWNKYTIDFTSTGQNYNDTSTIYPTAVNQLFGISSIRIFKNHIFMINERFLDNILPPNTINELVSGYNDVDYSINGWEARSYSTGSSGIRVAITNKSITNLGIYYLTPPSNSQMMAFYGTGSTDGNGQINDFNSISQEVNVPQGNYTFELSIAKRITGSIDYVKVFFESSNGYSYNSTITINDVRNTWTKYLLSLPSINLLSTILKITIFFYPAQYNQVIGLSSVALRQIQPENIYNNYELFPNAYNNNEYSLENYLIGKNTGNSYTTLSGIPKYGLSMNPINGFTIRCNLIKNNISHIPDFLETIPLINAFGSNNVFKGNDYSLTKIQKGKYRSIQFFLCDQKGNMIILLDPNLFINFCVGVGKPTTPSLTKGKSLVKKPLAKPISKKPIEKPIVKPVVKPIVKSKPLKITL
jgi:hypothetical protein